MKFFEVDVYFGDGGDTDAIGTYLVYAMNEEDAMKEAIGESSSLINASAKLHDSDEPIDEMNYDGILGPATLPRGEERSSIYRAIE